MTSPSQLNYDPDAIYPESDGNPIAESDFTRDYLFYSVEALSVYFRDRSDVYVAGNLFIYYEQGFPNAVISPDVFVIFGAEKKKRRIYKAWEEGNNLPSFVLEITSIATRDEDSQDKLQKYQRLGMLEYFQYDPTEGRLFAAATQRITLSSESIRANSSHNLSQW